MMGRWIECKTCDGRGEVEPAESEFDEEDHPDGW